MSVRQSCYASLPTLKTFLILSYCRCHTFLVILCRMLSIWNLSCAASLSLFTEWVFRLAQILQSKKIFLDLQKKYHRRDRTRDPQHLSIACYQHGHSILSFKVIRMICQFQQGEYISYFKSSIYVCFRPLLLHK